MVILWGRVFLMSEAPLYRAPQKEAPWARCAGGLGIQPRVGLPECLGIQTRVG
jgi:hypothetical protein